MKRTIMTMSGVCAAIFSIVLAMSMYTNISLANGKAAKITFEEPKHDFGKVKAGVDLTFRFKFKNEGEENLIIQQVHASCGCTGASIGEKKVFAQNEVGEIKVSFNTAGRSGVQNKTVTVQSNDPEHPFAVVSFTCDIVAQHP